jgi:hypothetical protein
MDWRWKHGYSEDMLNGWLQGWETGNYYPQKRHDA